MTMEAQYLTNQFLIAMPALGDPNFNQTVTYICEHTSEGALGIVINRPMNVKLGEILSQLAVDSVDDAVSDIPVLLGGPVQQDRGFVLHDNSGGQWDSSLEITSDIRVTTSRDILTAMARGDGPDNSLVALGCAGWDAGQLEQEIVANAWLSVAATEKILFDTAFDERWKSAAALLGVDLSTLSTDAGHA